MKAKLNIWVRDRTCALVKGRSHLHVYDCQRRPLYQDLVWFSGGHIEVEVPPGCYLVTVGTPGGNIYTDLTMVIVRCGDDACVNLVLNDYRRTDPFPHNTPVTDPLPLVIGGCQARNLIPFLINAKEARIKTDEMQVAFEVMIRAAGLDKKAVLKDIKNYISDIEKYIGKASQKEKEEIKPFMEHVKLLNEHPLLKG